MLANRKNSKDPGDNGEMVRGRHSFLQKGYYKFLAEEIAAGLDEHLGSNATVVDVGCGEGYYTRFISKSDTRSLIGIDISKHAVKLAAKSGLKASWAVASAFDLPLIDGACDAAVSVFSPMDVMETARILGPRGVVIHVGPGTEHLRSLATIVYGNFNLHRGNHHHLNQSDLFEELSSTELRREAQVDGGDLANLLAMTPYYWHASEETKLSISNLPSLKVEFHFVVRELRRRGPMV